MSDTAATTAMERREIGASGIRASAIGLGTWAIGGWMWGGTDEADSIAAIRASVDTGVTLIDTAPAYGMGRSEEIVGKAIAGRRDEVVLATKCGLVWHTDKGNHFFDQDGKPVHRYLGPESIAHELEQSLRRLGTDHIDLYITHWQDPTTPIAETMGALEDLRKAGKIRAIGASAWLIWTAPITTSRGGGTCTVRKRLAPSSVVTIPERPERNRAANSSASGSPV